jgi:hypothetical protein
MSESVSGHNVTTLPVRNSIVGITLIGFELGGVPVALDPSAIPGSGEGGGGGGGVALSDAAALPLGAIGAAGTASTAARADHTHPRPTAAQIGAAAVSHQHSIADVQGLRTELDDLAVNGGAALATTAPVALGATALAGTSLEAARADHRHPYPTAVQIGAAAAAHTHAMADVTGLQGALDAEIATASRGAANGVAPLGADSKVPAANLPASISSSNLVNGTANGQVAVWDQTDARYEPQTPDDITAVRLQTVEINTGTGLTFALHNGRILALTALAPLTVALSQFGTAPDQGMGNMIYNHHTAANTLTFPATGVTVHRLAGTTGTGQSVTIPSKGILTWVVIPVGATLLAICATQIPAA